MWPENWLVPMPISANLWTALTRLNLSPYNLHDFFMIIAARKKITSFKLDISFQKPHSGDSTFAANEKGRALARSHTKFRLISSGNHSRERCFSGAAGRFN